jgi:hypothetical protein
MRMLRTGGLLTTTGAGCASGHDPGQKEPRPCRVLQKAPRVPQDAEAIAVSIAV